MLAIISNIHKMERYKMIGSGTPELCSVRLLLFFVEKLTKVVSIWKTAINNQIMSIIGRQYLDGGAILRDGYDGGDSGAIPGHGYDRSSKYYPKDSITERFEDLDRGKKDMDRGKKNWIIVMIVICLIIAFLLWYFGLKT